MSGIILPRIRRVSVSGFEPLFTDGKLKIELLDGPFLLLGGNGLGKTTTLQTVIFALAGEADPHIEEKTDFQWGASYFKSRLNDAAEAEIEVEFSLDDIVISVRRRMNTKTVQGIKIGKHEWIHDSALAAPDYEKIVCEAGGYQNFEDFRYLLHRLCYLAENRRSLLWDQSAQLRVVMLVCGDSHMEREFRLLRAALKETDSEMRHAHVDISKLENRLNHIAVTKGKRETEKDNEKEPDGVMRSLELVSKLEAELQPLSKKRFQLHHELIGKRRALSAINSDLEKLQITLSQQEDAFVLSTLRGMEKSSSALALHKLLVHELCPFCTQKAPDLAEEALAAVTDGLCPICGNKHATPVSAAEIGKLRQDIMEKTPKQDELQRTVNSLEDQESDLTSREIAIKDRLNLLVSKLPRVQFAEVSELVGNGPDEIRERLRTTQAHHAKLEAKKRLLQQELEEKYTAFSNLCSRRLTQLAALAGEYAAKFLGAPCEFVMTPSRERLSPFSFYVPQFAGKKRETPESCSESERFFLDIAFRMSVLVFAGVLSKTRSTFICETPENALDLAYTDNVAAMFSKFSIAGFSILLTANLQLGGVAKPLLQAYPKPERRQRVINLIEICHLTDVQAGKKKEFLKVYKDIVG